MSHRWGGVAALALVLVLDGSAGARAEVTGHPDPLSLLASENPLLAENKRLVFDLWRGIVNAGHVELADALLTEDYIQHSPVLPTGRTAFKQIFSAVPRLEQIPATVSPPLVALVAEGPYVVMALAETVSPPDGGGTYTTTHFNLFRVENGRLAEHWHSVQTAPGPDVPTPEDGGPQPVTGRVGIDQYALLESAEPGLAWNKRQVFDVWRQLADAGREELVELYVDPDFVGRSPIVTPARDGFAAYFATRPTRPIATSLDDPLVAMVAEGDLVVQVRGLLYAHPSRAGETYTTTWFDMFRLGEDGRLIEHWDPALRPAPAAACAPDARLTYLCGLENAEDIVAIDDRWLIASSITTRGEVAGAGRLYLIDAASRTAEELFPGTSPRLRRDAAIFGDCAIDLAAFDTHGLALRALAPDRYRLYATSHGAREAVQAFELDMSGARPAIAWVGCVPLPADVWANSVAILPDGGFLATQFYDPLDPESIGRVLRGEPNGSIIEWHPDGDVVAVPGTRLSGPNGIALSPDDRYLFVAAFGGRSVLRFDRTADAQAPAAVSLDISPDNLRWTGRGTLLTAGPNAEAGTGWTAYEIDPATLSAAPRARADGAAALQSASTAIEVGTELWFGTPGGDRVGILASR